MNVILGTLPLPGPGEHGPHEMCGPHRAIRPVGQEWPVRKGGGHG
jgi:hypothetical protein